MTKDALNYKALHIEGKGKEALVKVRSAIVDTGIEQSCYAVRARVKAEGKLVEKVARKRETKPAYELESITDVIGIRLVTLFRRDLPDILTKVLDVIEHSADLRPNPVKKSSLEEIVVYNSELESSAFNLLIKETLDQRQVPFKKLDSKEGYSSIHIVCRVGKDVVRCDEIGPNYLIPIEVQIRTVFEDAWGEIDHKYGYVARSGKDVSLAGNQALVGPHLRVLKQFTDACAAYADTIKEMSTDDGAVATKAGRILSVESDDDVLRRFEQLGVPRSYIEQYANGRAIREKCAAPTLGKQERTVCYLDASQYFHSIAQQCEKELQGEGLKLYWYYVTLNAAFCLLSTNASESIESAVGIYLDLAEKYANYPLVKFRLGQAYSKLGKVDDSIRLFEDALGDVQQLAAASKAKQSWEDNLPLPDYKHISTALPKLLGYQYWQKGAFRTDPTDVDQRLSLYRKAYEVTLLAYDITPENADLANNLVYYALEYLALNPKDEFAYQLVERLSKYMPIIEQAAKSEEADAMLLDTLLQLYIVTEQKEAAKALAARVFEVLEASEEIPDMIARAIQARVLKVMKNT
ncbi:RelA/SpoT domain-containing protein (plasmid) [Cupriavidus necator]|uniref:RelA/SpoT domain-containing protein n=1 Tax=Cupriavidus necator TaxID=106590 RepID=A0A367PR74_CUPNE|nr:RelA/SpoT domain-containing protein [Cupriavidus necator]QQX89735.1 RelA/SpoT domain-containing protein [Cupriavidus necator]RCJ10459.1 hypothetical protein DDK22_00400 [Cupriavidus necator]